MTKTCEYDGCDKSPRTKNNRFCGTAHSASMTRNGAKAAMAKRAPRYCPVCNTQHDQKRLYCSDECMHTQHAKTGKRPTLESILVENSSARGDKVKTRLLSVGLLKFECAECKITEWRGQPAPLQLDHINGKNRDHRLENLRLLCPNCHAQTDTFCGRNKPRSTMG